MSVRERKISFLSIEFEEGEERSFDPEVFERLLLYIDGLAGGDRIFKDDKSKKAVDIQSIRIYEKDERKYAQIVFKSCKYNHSPNYMSSIDGTERPTTKDLTEGEKELTHMCMRLDEEEAFTVFEERKSGVSIGSVLKYLNKNLMKLRHEEDSQDTKQLSYGIVPSENFLESLSHVSRVSEAELYVKRKVIGNGFLDITELNEESREDVMITVKSRPRRNIGIAAIRGAFRRMAAEESVLSRIRVYGKGEDNKNLVLDTDMAKRQEEISVELSEDGTVDSISILEKMSAMLGEQNERAVQG